MDKTLRSALVTVETPEEAVARLERLHSEATSALRRRPGALFRDARAADSPEERARFRYPEIRVSYEPEGVQPSVRRAFAKFPAPGVYATTVTQPAAFRAYLLEQLRPLMHDYGADGRGRRQRRGNPLSLRVRARRRAFARGRDGGRARSLLSGAACSRRWATRSPTAAGPASVGMPRPLALFDAVRVDYLAAPAHPLHGRRLAQLPILDHADQLPSLRRSVHPLGARAGARDRARSRSWSCPATS